MSIFTRIGNVPQAAAPRTLTEEIAANFTAYLNDWHSRPETYDDALDAQIHRWYADVLTDKSRKVWPPKGIPYFSPSAADADPRSLYEKLRGAKKDGGGQSPHQGRWTRLGTSIGDLIQRDILFAEKHTDAPRFKFERNDRKEPMFENFAPGLRTITRGGQTFALYGFCDGLMTYRTDDGELIRVGLEVKSKQTTNAQTSEYGQRNGPNESHVKQTVCYSIMYGSADAPIDYYVILYVNGSKKAWGMTPEEYAKNPDIAVHCIEITDEMRVEVLDRFAGIVDAAAKNVPPALDLGNWTFNNFKRACAVGLTAEELAQLERQVDAIQRSGLKDYEKRNYAAAFAELTALRNGGTA